MDGPAILKSVREAYASCASYQDSGDVISVFVSETPRPRRRTTSRPFSTWFARPDRFRFEFFHRDVGPQEEWDRFVLWERDRTARSWWSARGERESKDLETLIAGFHGISGASSSRVSRMLMPDRFKQGELAVTFLGDEPVDGQSCHKVGISWQVENRTLEKTWWVGVDDFLIRRVFDLKKMDGEERKRIHDRAMEHLRKAQAEGRLSGRLPKDFSRTNLDSEPFVCETTTTYSPVLNGAIPDQVFDFEPPA